MTTTDNYDLKVYEGTDVFNPLIVENANTEAIDTAMHDNAIASVPTATELKSGTVHALTRSNAEASMFRFVATSEYAAGDTFTVDGIQVTGLLPSGQTLGDGAYVINANVLCCLVGTNLTLYVPTGNVVTADNALKLGGEEPSYYGTASDVTSATAVAQAASVLVNQLNSNLIDLLQGTLASGETSLTISNSKITTSSIIEPFFFANGETEPICYKTISVVNGSVTMTFSSRDADLLVGIRVM